MPCVNLNILIEMESWLCWAVTTLVQLWFQHWFGTRKQYFLTFLLVKYINVAVEVERQAFNAVQFLPVAKHNEEVDAVDCLLIQAAAQGEDIWGELKMNYCMFLNMLLYDQDWKVFRWILLLVVIALPSKRKIASHDDIQCLHDVSQSVWAD